MRQPLLVHPLERLYVFEAVAEDDLVDKRAEEAESVAVDLDQLGDDGAKGDAEAAGLDESVDEEQH